MNLKLLAILLVGSTGIFWYTAGQSVFASAEPPTEEQVLAKTIIDNLSSYHYEPLAVDDTLAARAYRLYFNSVDGSHRFFTQSDLDIFNSYLSCLDESLANQNFDLFNLSYRILQYRLSQTEQFYREILASPIDFSVNETIDTDFDKLPASKNETELRELWRKVLKMQVLANMSDLIEAQDKKEKEYAEGKGDKTKPFVKKNQSELEEEARKKVLKNNDDWFRRMKNTKRSEYIGYYLNAMAMAYDPHTGYYPPDEKQNFDISMSGRMEGIGAKLQVDGEYVKVIEIVPGSPSWKQGELKVDDLILKVGQADAEPVDVTNMNLDEVVKMIRGKKGTEVRLTLKKVDGSTKIISIIRDEIINDEGFAKSAIITDAHNNRRIGFISLPRFYADFDNDQGRFCAKDVRTELQKLATEKVEGIILDLRNNGGGSLNDVVEMSGLFIPNGPIVQVKSKNEKPRVLYDTDNSVVYDGPLVVLVNNNSASASEILAAALQDYSRAVIVGSTSTFGKGTVQRFFDLNKIVSQHQNDLGALKITLQKFYRINGSTTQLKGVIPDIVLPDSYNYIRSGERSEDYPMRWDEIPAASYKPYTKVGNLEQVKSASAARVKNNPTFALIEEQAKLLKQRDDQTIRSLNFDQYEAEEKKLIEQSKKFETIRKEISHIAAENLLADQTQIATDSSRMARLADWHTNIKKDVYIEEALNIIYDIIQTR